MAANMSGYDFQRRGAGAYGEDDDFVSAADYIAATEYDRYVARQEREWAAAEADAQARFFADRERSEALRDWAADADDLPF